MKIKKIAVLLFLSITILTLVACGGNADNSGNANNEKTDITIACAETTQAMVEAVVPLMAEKGYNVTYQLFDNNVNTLVATNDGSVDSVFLVHKPFMENFNESNDGDLLMLEPHVFAVGMGLFSEKYNSIDEIPDGASIAIINDSMNMDRGLRILRDGGLITLTDNIEQATLIDITENPHGLQFVEMDQTQTVRSLQDMDGVIAFFSHMKNADKDFNSYLIRDQHPEEYPQGVVVKAENADAPWARDLVEAFRSDEMREFTGDHYGGLYEYID
jgi:D-methionine transport system substrate-binding protein